MDTMMWEILAGILIFAAANMAYFEIRRLIQLLRGHFKKSKSLTIRQDSTVGPAV
jgi:hypothetical protein